MGDHRRLPVFTPDISNALCRFKKDGKLGWLLTLKNVKILQAQIAPFRAARAAQSIRACKVDATQHTAVLYAGDDTHLDDLNKYFDEIKSNWSERVKVQNYGPNKNIL